MNMADSAAWHADGMLRRRPLAAALLLATGLLCCLAPAQAEEPQFLEARVVDASDRAYEPAAIWLIDQARASIALSMYLVREADDDRHPVNRLLNDLLEARQRGVAVTIYLNTKFKGGNPAAIGQTPWLARLRQAGATVVTLPPDRRLHDKLLIVNERYVLEGSTNWSVSALAANRESNTLIDSPTLAKIKLIRLRHLQPDDTATTTPDEPPPVPDTLALPVAALQREGLAVRLAAGNDERAFDAWLVLLRAAAAQASWEFFIDLEDLGDDLGLPEEWDDTAVRRQVIKTLRKLAERYRALEVRFSHGQDAWVKLLLPGGPAEEVPTAWLEPSRLQQEPAAVTYLRLLRAHLARQGIDFDALSTDELTARTGLKPKRLRDASRQLR